MVRDLESLMSYVEKGTKARKTASTLQNPSSSRSHALLTVDLTREQGSANAERPSDGDSITSSGRQDVTQRAGSRLHLVDLAGSESAATCGGVHRLKVSHSLKIISFVGMIYSPAEFRAMKIDIRAGRMDGWMELRRVINLLLAAIAVNRVGGEFYSRKY